jgi:hypothetical protein
MVSYLVGGDDVDVAEVGDAVPRLEVKDPLRCRLAAAPAPRAGLQGQRLGEEPRAEPEPLPHLYHKRGSRPSHGAPHCYHITFSYGMQLSQAEPRPHCRAVFDRPRRVRRALGQRPLLGRRHVSTSPLC